MEDEADLEAAPRQTEKFYTEGSQELQWARRQVEAFSTKFDAAHVFDTLFNVCLRFTASMHCNCQQFVCRKVHASVRILSLGGARPVTTPKFWIMHQIVGGNLHRLRDREMMSLHCLADSFVLPETGTATVAECQKEKGEP